MNRAKCSTLPIDAVVYLTGDEIELDRTENYMPQYSVETLNMMTGESALSSVATLCSSTSIRYRFAAQNRVVRAHFQYQ